MTILHIDSSINGENSASRRLTESIVGRVRRSNWGEEVVYRDLAAEPLAHLTLDAFTDTAALEEFLEAGVVVIGAPMYNFTLPTQLKAWIDRIVVAGKTFQYGANGPEGLATGKRVIIAVARGNVYSGDAPAAVLEHLESYLRGIFNFIGIEPEFVVAEGLGISPEQREQSLELALGETVRLAA